MAPCHLGVYLLVLRVGRFHLRGFKGGWKPSDGNGKHGYIEVSKKWQRRYHVNVKKNVKETSHMYLHYESLAGNT